MPDQGEVILQLGYDKSNSLIIERHQQAKNGKECEYEEITEAYVVASINMIRETQPQVARDVESWQNQVVDDNGLAMYATWSKTTSSPSQHSLHTWTRSSPSPNYTSSKISHTDVEALLNEVPSKEMNTSNE